MYNGHDEMWYEMWNKVIKQDYGVTMALPGYHGNIVNWLSTYYINKCYQGNQITRTVLVGGIKCCVLYY